MPKDKRFRLTFLGAAQTVTGSMHMLEVGERSLIVDCGMYQGRRKDSNHRNRNLPRRAVEADAVLLTHAHIDHSGNLPSLVKRGFRGPIHATSATGDLCDHMLRDSARIQVNDARWINKKRRKDPDWEPVEPLYDEKDAERALELFVPHEYEAPFELWPGVTVRYIDAGHVLGSSSILVDVKLNGHTRRIAFSGDIGRRNLPILRDPTPPERPDYVVMESTYGNRLHAAAEGMGDQLLDAIDTARERQGKIIIPSFSLERTQEIVFCLNRLLKAGRLRPLPIYVDSPLSTNLTQVFRRHPECYDAETAEFHSKHGDPFGFGMLTMITEVEDSKRLNTLKEPAIIISASGMCEGGRVVHHLRNSIEDSRNMVVIVGYQAQHTLGRRLVERRPQVRIFGVKRELKAEVRVLNAFSAHADRDELIWWAKACGRQVRRYFCVHGDTDQCEALAGHLQDNQMKTMVPAPGQTADLDY